ncbi:ectoine hydroxylase-related dioxygenase (phytanoyl-CoA dioxygenase family) [Paenibacillus cellulosilyticus]|uniref:Ectoine hydroxylase-related dioxygenase (Phytanoyl-CoA dioxygenase family) n=1 Tax=Paenibacillus cellulosilyticus TaxID=375489 RepID=A0A2V2YVF6_9BACL|nr:phytanoyl-CoA dioxygenase family protein [Paenibacillus cellulosilyticus]PWW03195.1 ectoine hydroxylase-related dioxygenase (phytanoyl-CoA dioxygenase family) [Paenibacillus cellulosilyticus]
MLHDIYIPELPSLSEQYVISNEQKKYFQEHGHIHLKGVASREEVQYFRPYILDTMWSHYVESEDRSSPYSKAFIEVTNLWSKSMVVRKFVLAKRFARIASDLLDANGVRLRADTAIFKEPGGGPTPMHQDQMSWSLETDKVIGMWMPLIDLTEDIGSMTFYSGTHKWGDISRLSTQEVLKKMKSGVKEVNYGVLELGDVTIHNGWTMHSAPPNRSKRMREVIAMSYFADNTRISDPGDNRFAQQGLERYFPGLKPGDIAASELTPLVYMES